MICIVGPTTWAGLHTVYVRIPEPLLKTLQNQLHDYIMEKVSAQLAGLPVSRRQDPG